MCKNGKLEGRALVKWLLNNPRRLEIAVLGELGMSNKLIRRELHVHDSYIQTVLRRADIKRKDYRDGVNKTSQRAISSMRSFAQREISSHATKRQKE